MSAIGGKADVVAEPIALVHVVELVLLQHRPHGAVIGDAGLVHRFLLKRLQLCSLAFPAFVCLPFLFACLFTT
jgi:hypothetical protein